MDGQLNNVFWITTYFFIVETNPINRIEDSGQGWWGATCVAVSGLVGGAVRIVSSLSTGRVGITVYLEQLLEELCMEVY